MMQAGSDTVGKGNVMDTSLAMHPGGPEPAGLLILGIFGGPETHIVIEGDAVVDMR